MDMEERIKALEEEVKNLKTEVSSLRNAILSIHRTDQWRANPYSPRAPWKPSAPF